MIRISYDRAVFTWNYQTYHYILAVDIYDILMSTHHRI